MSTFATTHDEFTRGFELGMVYQLIRSGREHAQVMVSATVARRAMQIGQAHGYRAKLVRSPGTPVQYRVIQFDAVDTP